ncbi:hypothetical protein DL98DRAFT_541461 [Cadophora sp. DSE1049]|nr:hypothetical protein DL98DRAFT_541461 [Cadophora sp. DSE1049]
MALSHKTSDKDSPEPGTLVNFTYLNSSSPSEVKVKHLSTVLMIAVFISDTQLTCRSAGTGYDGVERHEDVMGLSRSFFSQRRDQQRVSELEGDVMVCLYVTEAIEGDLLVRPEPRSCSQSGVVFYGMPSAWQKFRTITSLRVITNKLQLGCFKLEVRILLIYQFQPEDFKSAQKHDSVSNSIIALGIGSLYDKLQLGGFLTGYMNFWRTQGRPK